MIFKQEFGEYFFGFSSSNTRDINGMTLFEKLKTDYHRTEEECIREELS